MNKIEEIKKEFEDKFDVLWKEYELEKYDGTKQTGTISVTEDVWNFLEQAITKSNEETVRGFANYLLSIKKDDEIYSAFEKDVIVHGLQGAINDRIKQYLTQKEEE